MFAIRMLRRYQSWFTWMGLALLGTLLIVPATAFSEPAGFSQSETQSNQRAGAGVPVGSVALPDVQPTATAFTHTVWLPFVARTSVAYRLGYGAVSTPIDRLPEISSLRAGWYLDWNVRSKPARPNDMEYVQVIRVHQKLTCPLRSAEAHDRILCPYAVPHDYVFSPDLPQIAAAAQANPGSLWLIGNEMDRRDWQDGGQDEILPETYAVAYHDLFREIKRFDPMAQVAIGGVIQATPLRLEYLTKAWNAYQQKYGIAMPVDVWNVHNFILKERAGDYGAGIPPGSTALQGVVYQSDLTHVDMGIFDQQIRAFRAWMKARGQQNKPLIVSEYGVLYWHEGMEDPVLVQNFMIQTFDYFLNTRDCSLGYPADDCRLVQRWAWYSLDDTGIHTGFNQYGALFDPTTRQITATGARFRTYSLTNMSRLAR